MLIFDWSFGRAATICTASPDADDAADTMLMNY